MQRRNENRDPIVKYRNQIVQAETSAGAALAAGGALALHAQGEDYPPWDRRQHGAYHRHMSEQREPPLRYLETADAGPYEEEPGGYWYWSWTSDFP
jgi:hypothetical protein